VLATNAGLTLNEGATATITNAELQVTDADNTATQIVFTVTTNTTNGELKKNGTTLNSSETFTQDDIDNNRITYVHDGGETTSDSFQFTVSDGAGGTIGSTTFSITVNAVNDPPVVTGDLAATQLDRARELGRSWRR
jgi:VCBS repeat-containing protein